MVRFNQYVKNNEIAQIGDNGYNFTSQSLTQFGLFPKFELLDNQAYIVEYIPRGGLCSLLFGNSFFGPQETLKSINAFYDESWVKLYHLRELLGYRINGCIIKRSRIDTFEVNYNINIGNTTYVYLYNVKVKAEINPMSFYMFLKKNRNNRDLLSECIKEFISKKIIDKLKDSMNPTLNITITELPDNVQEEQYQINNPCLQGEINFIDSSTPLNETGNIINYPIVSEPINLQNHPMPEKNCFHITDSFLEKAGYHITELNIRYVNTRHM